MILLNSTSLIFNFMSRNLTLSINKSTIVIKVRILIVNVILFIVYFFWDNILIVTDYGWIGEVDLFYSVYYYGKERVEIF